MRLLIIEPNASGHHMALHGRLLVKEAIRRRWKVDLMTTRTTSEHPAMRLVEAEANGGLRVHLMPEISAPPARGSLGAAMGQFRYYDAVAAGFHALPADVRPDLTYVINLDNLAKAIALRGTPFRRAPFSGMLMGLGYHRRAMRIGPVTPAHALQKLMVRRLLSIPTLRSVALIDECLAEYHQHSPKRLSDKFTLVPDVGEIPQRAVSCAAKEEARNALGIPTDQFTILLYGTLAMRKGVRELIDAVADRGPEHTTVLLAGREDDDVRAYLAGGAAAKLRASGRLIHSRGFHGAADEARVFAAADAVWVGYVDFYGSSGVLFQAGSAGLPVIGSREGLIGWLVQRYQTGVVCDPRDKGAVTRAIAALGDTRAWAAFVENGRRLAREHTGELFASSLCDVIARGSGAV